MDDSRQANVVVALELARRYGDQGIVSTALNPGNIKSDLQRYLPWFVRAIFVRPPLVSRACLTSAQDRIILYDTSLGALTQLYAGTMPEAAEFNGKVGAVAIVRLRGVLNVSRAPRPMGTPRSSVGGDSRPRARQKVMGLARGAGQGRVKGGHGEMGRERRRVLLVVVQRRYGCSEYNMMGYKLENTTSLVRKKKKKLSCLSTLVTMIRVWMCRVSCLVLPPGRQTTTTNERQPRPDAPVSVLPNVF